MNKRAIIIGAGPAGLTAAYELLQRTGVTPVILEKTGDIGGISKTMVYKGNRMDMGPHRFFSKSDRVMNWWLNMMPLETNSNENVTINYQNKSRSIPSETPTPMHTEKDPGKVMLVIPRLTRIYFLRKFFAYPIQLTVDTLKTLGLVVTIKIIFSYLWAQVFKRKPETSLEDFIINKFGKTLYLLFFKDYTEKVWGIAPSVISAEWGAQRIKGVSLSKAVAHAVKTIAKGKKKEGIDQKDTETSLIEQFLYPKYGPGSLWEETARQVKKMGGQIYLHQDVQKINTVDGNVASIETINRETGETFTWEGDYFFSTMPVQELVAGMGEQVPAEVKRVAAGLLYRDFINVGMLLKRLSSKNIKTGENETVILKDNWIYIQERDVKVGRLMIYNNWGGGMIKDPDTTWIGMEYFCNKTDDFWQLSDEEVKKIAIQELLQMDLATESDILDITVARMEKTYPAYFGTYHEFDKIRAYTDTFENLFLVGRNGMHKYNNADHSMLCAMVAVDNIEAGITTKQNLWEINTEQEYHEVKKNEDNDQTPGAAGAVAEQEKIPAPATSAKATRAAFTRFIFNEHKGTLIIAGILSLLAFIGFKLMYPHANFMYDSYYYLGAAANNSDVNIWPVGYSKFLRLVSVFTHSDNAVVIIQYLALQIAFGYFFYTLWYLAQPGKLVRWLMIVFFTVNPAILSITNYILSDALFTAGTMVWFTQLIWIVYKPNKRLIWTHALLLFVLFTLRYNAMFYPVITAGVFIYTYRHMLWVKIGSAALTALLISGFVWHTAVKNGEIIGKNTFSPFSGWQLASNALIMYRNMPEAYATDNPPANLQPLHKLVVHHLDSLNHLKVRPDSAIHWYYLWTDVSPLRKYMAAYWKKDTLAPEYKRWASMGLLYGEYGRYLISKHPSSFVKNYISAGTAWYTVPDVELLNTYNQGSDSLSPFIRNWFDIKTYKPTKYNKKIPIVKEYTVVATVVNVLFLLGIAGILLLGLYYRLSKNQQLVFILSIIFWSINFLFSITTALTMLRYEIFVNIFSLSLGAYFVEFIYMSDSIKNSLQQLGEAKLHNTPQLPNFSN